MSSRRLWILPLVPVVLVLLSQLAWEAGDARDDARARATVAATPAPPNSPGNAQGRVAVPETRPTAPSVAPARVGPARLRVPADRIWNQPVPEPALEQFRTWTFAYLAADPADRTALTETGVALAKSRRESLLPLIQSAPEIALDRSVPLQVRQHLPPEVLELLEERIDGRGDFSVFAALPAPGQEGQVPPSWRTVQLGDRLFTAHVYGRRLDEPTRNNIPLHGLALENHLALDENPVRILEAAESEEALNGDPLCGVAGWQASAFDSEVAVDDGDDTVVTLCSPAHAEELNRKLILAESQSGSTEVTAEGSVRPASAFTEGIKRLILIRVDFSDKPGEPFSNSRGTNLVQAIDTFFRENSYGRAGFRALGAGSVVTPTLRLPRRNAEYGTLDASRIREDARAAARAAGFVLSNFDFDVICFRSVPGYGWAGLGYVGAPGSWVQDAFDERAGVFCHELGHNFGLTHANFWDTAGESVIGAKGTSVEYGDSFDTMGNASAGRRHFNVRNKAYLNWLRTSAEIQTLSVSGTYRLQAHDLTNAAGIRALRAPRDSQNAYWFEYRARFADNRWMSNGVGVRRARSDSARQSQLLDTTPGSAEGKTDSPLVIGRTFSDPTAGLHVTPTRLLDTVPPSIEVVVHRGAFPENRPPSIAVNSSATVVPLNGTVSLQAQASDPDGDALAYAWDFGDGNFGPNQAAVSHRWSTTGDYLVRCVASDMKGQTRSDFIVVRVGTPNTLRISGRVLRDGQPLDGVRVFVSNTRLTYTGSDGTYVLTGLTPGQYTVKAQAEGLLFTREGFSNPLNLSTSRTGVDFVGALPGDLEFASLIPAGAEWRYQDEGRDLGTTWRQPSFSDSTWKRGPAQLGYGDDDVVTAISFGSDPENKFITTYFRHSFVVSDPGRILSATLGLIRDDGAVVYLNGREVFRSNMPSGTVGYRTLASSAVSGSDESTFFETELAGTDFLEGQNLLAVEIHQSSADSSDVSFNLRLEALLAPGSGVGLFPSLASEVTPEGIRLSWPAAFTGYSLQSRDALDASGDWEPVEGPVETAGDQVRVLLPTTGSARFLRLYR